MTPTPLGFPCNSSPGGSVFGGTLQLTVGVPPVVAMFWLYGEPAVPFGNVLVPMLSTGLIVILRI